MPRGDPRFPIKMSPNGRSFVDGEGKPILWLGMTQWELFSGYSLDDRR